MVAPLSRTLRHQLPGWKRSSWIRQPPAVSTTMVENAIAFMCVSGSGVITRSASGRTVHRWPSPAYHRPASQEVAVAQHAALGPPGGARGVEQRAFAVSPIGSSRRAAARRAARAARRRRPPRAAMSQRASAAALRSAAACARQRHRQHDLAVLDQVAQFGRAQVGVDRHHADAQRIEREPVQQEGRAVLQQQPDAVAMAVARRGVRPPQRLDLRRCIGPAQRARARCRTLSR